MNLYLDVKEVVIRNWWRKTIKGVKNGNVLELERGSFNEELYRNYLEAKKEKK
jgi:hypothetical protein